MGSLSGKRESAFSDPWTGTAEGQTDGQALLGDWLLHFSRKPQRLQVVSDARGIDPVDVLLDDKALFSIDRPSANTGARVASRWVDRRRLVVSLTSPDDGRTVACQVSIDGHRLSPTDPEVNLADFVPEGQRRAWEVFAAVNVAAIVGLVMVAGLDGLLHDLGLSGRGPLTIGAFVVALAVFYAVAWWIGRQVSRWIGAHGWSTVGKRVAWVAYFAAQLAAFGCFLIVAGLVLRSF